LQRICNNPELRWVSQRPYCHRNLQAFHYNVVAFGKQGHFAKSLQTGTRIKLVVQAQSQPDNIASIPLLTATFVRPVLPVARTVALKDFSAETFRTR
jgi:hypothetical protein